MPFVAPYLDYHAFAPELVLIATFVAVLVADLIGERNKPLLGTIAGLGLLGSMVPVLTLAVADEPVRAMFGGGYVVDNFALTLKALFIIGGYVVILLSTNYIAEGDFWEGEYYLMLLASILGMTMMASSRDLVLIFVALELLSIPAYMLATWRKRDPKSNEAGLKYYLMGVFATAIMLYGMSLIFGVTGQTGLAAIAASPAIAGTAPVITLGVVFVIAGFGFKVSAVPFHTWAPDTYEGAPTPVTAFLSVASKAGGFVALTSLCLVGFATQEEVWQPLFWVLAALSMTVGNLLALRQTNIVRMLAYSSVAQGGYMLAPLAVAGHSIDGRRESIGALVVYLLVYGAMNLGAFAIVIAVARKTRSGEISSYGGLFQYAPGLTVVMTVFVFALAGIPPLGGWFAKFVIFKALVNPGTSAGYALAIVVGVNSVIALFYYARIAQQMWMQPVPDEDRTPIRVPPSLVGALGICCLVTLVLGVLPGLVGEIGDLAELASGR
ncbi:MAG: NADH-quinone oxidoreductase subunit N [Actinomycetota bacterium]|nr:NADH-quinone oxidoreductase subunit N [Acidimicrobiia bacterium]MDQ3293515.1 NADH-quinone oxidoreductase subunit N [Actinomycetota bacterium]